MASGGLGQLTIDLAANITKFDRSLKRAEVLAEKRSRTIKRQFTRLATGIGATLASFGFARAVEGALDFADAIGKAADRAGIGTTKLQELRFAADQFGISTKQIDDGLRRFTRRLGVALDGGSFEKDFINLGVSIRDMNGEIRDSEAVLDDVIRKMGGLESQAQKSKVAAQLFGDDAGPQLALLLGQGIGKVEELTDKAHRLGLIIDEDLIRSSETANDTMSALSQVIKTQTTAAIIELAPEITKLSQTLTDIVTGDSQRLPEWLKDVAFYATTAAREFQDLGNWAGAVSAIVNRALAFDLDGIQAIIDKRQENRAELEEDLEAYRIWLDTVSQAPGPATSSVNAQGNEASEKNFATGLTSAEMEQQINEITYLYDIWTKYDLEQAAIRKKAEADVAKFRQQTQASSVQNGIALLRVFGRESKGAALAALAIEKSLAIATAIAGTQAAMAKSRILDPSGALAAKIAVEGGINVATIAALGLAQAASINKQSGGGPSGSITDPYSVESFVPGGASTPTQSGSITINVNGVVTEEVLNDLMIPAIQDAVDNRDVVIISSTSYNGKELAT